MLTLDDPLTSILPEVKEPVMCESQYEIEVLKYPSHEAQWYAISPCESDVMAMCNDRRDLARREDGWWCIPGCKWHHVYSEIRWVPIT